MNRVYISISLNVELCKISKTVTILFCQVRELTAVEVSDTHLTFGASVTLSQLEATCTDLGARLPAWRMRILDQIVDMLQWFAGQGQSSNTDPTVTTE